MKYILTSLLACILTTGAFAHGGHDERLKMKLMEDTFIIETHISASLLRPFDRDGNGILTAGEFRSQTAAIKNWVGTHISVEAMGGARLEPIFFDTPVSEGDLKTEEGEIRFVRVLQHYAFRAPLKLDVTVSLFEQEGRAVLLFKDGKVYKRNFPAGVIKMALN